MNLSSQKLLLIKTPWLNYFIVDCTDDTSEIVWTCSQKLICVFLCPTHLRASFIWTSFLFRLKLQYKVCDATNASKLERWSVTVSKRVVLFWCEVMPKWNPVLLMNRCNFSKYVWKSMDVAGKWVISKKWYENGMISTLWCLLSSNIK